MEPSKKCFDIIKSFEGFKAGFYNCPAGHKTIGYGHFVSLNDDITPPITVNYAEQLLNKDINKIKKAIKTLVTVKLTQGQYDALVSLVYNWGISAFQRSNGLKVLNKGNYSGACEQFFSKKDGVVNIKGVFSQGLYNRRKAEETLWLSKN